MLLKKLQIHKLVARSHEAKVRFGGLAEASFSTHWVE